MSAKKRFAPGITEPKEGDGSVACVQCYLPWVGIRGGAAGRLEIGAPVLVVFPSVFPVSLSEFLLTGAL